jgi:hypothetical protein
MRPPFVNFFSLALLTIVGLSLALVLTGCGPGDQIARYKVPRTINKNSTKTVEEHTGHDLRWQAPSTWVPKPTPVDKRYATFLAGQGDSAIEIAISRWHGALGGELANINRWRRQLGMPQITQAQFDEKPLESIKVQGSPDDWKIFDTTTTPPGGSTDAPRRMKVIYLIGEAHSWFIKIAASAGAIDHHEQEIDQFVRSLDMVSKATGAPAFKYASGDIDQYQWDTAKDWTKLADPPQFVHTAYEVGEDQKLKISFSILGGQGGGLQANIARWQRQMGLDSKQVLDELGLPRTPVGDGQGFVVALETGEFDEALRNGMIAIYAPRADSTWIFKISGNRLLLGKHQGEFEGWISSVRATETAKAPEDPKESQTPQDSKDGKDAKDKTGAEDE